MTPPRAPLHPRGGPYYAAEIMGIKARRHSAQCLWLSGAEGVHVRDFGRDFGPSSSTICEISSTYPTSTFSGRRLCPGFPFRHRFGRCFRPNFAPPRCCASRCVSEVLPSDACPTFPSCRLFAVVADVADNTLLPPSRGVSVFISK